MKIFVKKSVLEELQKSFNQRDFKRIKLEIIEHLKNLEDDESDVEKSFGVGTVRVWAGKKYKKISESPNRWVRIYDKTSRGAKNAITRLIHQAEKIETPEEMMQFVLANKQRFSDSNGKPLDIVDRLQKVIDAKNEAYDKESENEDDENKELDGKEHVSPSEAVQEKQNAKKDLKDLADTIKNKGTLNLKNDNIGEVTLTYNVNKSDLKHIIERRYAELKNKYHIEDDDERRKLLTSFVYSLLQTIKHGSATMQKDGRSYILKNKGISAVARQNKSGKIVVTGFVDDSNEKEGTETIAAVNADYSYTPEFLELYAQVGATLPANNDTANNKNVNEEPQSNADIKDNVNDKSQSDSKKETSDAEEHNNRSNAMKGNQNAKKDFTEADKQEVLNNLKNPTEKILKVGYSRENYNELFPRGKSETPLGKIRLSPHQFERLGEKDKGARKQYLGLLSQTLKNPDVIIDEIDSQGRPAKVWIKSVIDENKTRYYIAITPSFDGVDVVVSNGPREYNQIENKIKMASSFYYKAEGGSRTARTGVNPLPSNNDDNTNSKNVNGKTYAGKDIVNTTTTDKNQKIAVAKAEEIKDGGKEIVFKATPQLTKFVEQLTKYSSKDFGRYFMTGLGVRDGFLWATDGRRLMRLKVDGLDGLKSNHFESNFTNEGVSDCYKCEIKDGQIILTQFDAIFPNGEKVIPKYTGKNKAEINNKVLLEKLKSMEKDGAVNKKKDGCKSVALEIKGGKCFVDGTEIGTCSGLNDGHINFNYQYLQDALKNADTSTICFDSEKPDSRAVAISTNISDHVIMPMNSDEFPNYEGRRQYKTDNDKEKERNAKAKAESNINYFNSVKEDYKERMSGAIKNKIQNIKNVADEALLNVIKVKDINIEDLAKNKKVDFHSKKFLEKFGNYRFENFVMNYLAMQDKDFADTVEAEIKRRGLTTTKSLPLFFIKDGRFYVRKGL